MNSLKLKEYKERYFFQVCEKPIMIIIIIIITNKNKLLNGK